ncbi:hypothetical protein L2E82_38049 [Cichorium intybus]|uniref:Uncharacterized protein n=1 Tax=Cichorium intybus TaxID=13427 RepID=A0ACB9AF92_CICIN|nr:hypothetical protein L2E82_38049 [Cichorium intybus]
MNGRRQEFFNAGFSAIPFIAGEDEEVGRTVEWGWAGIHLHLVQKYTKGNKESYFRHRLLLFCIYLSLVGIHNHREPKETQQAHLDRSYDAATSMAENKILNPTAMNLNRNIFTPS